MTTTTLQRVELPAGYSVVDRLGAGGYGEVWKAIAPGGLEKAVKIVFGHCDECMAERELKSLDRVKSVRHPFLLSIERYEIVNNRLVIVTELADMSLSDCFQNHISAGRSGVPREQLIAYLWDAADALDCLLEHHSLQHLDIKPENLLVVGDHIKVADFGLVKELASKTLNSVMGGMTPLYSAPEIYDNNPSPRSDQYSLAIVFQHMLTGTLPFSGRTPAQLAKQHTLAEPNVNPLSGGDRAIVRRALEKNPQGRFASCREFVAALRSGGLPSHESIFTPSPASITPQPRPIPGDDTKSISLADTRQLRDPVCIAATQKLAELESGVSDLDKLERGSPPTALKSGFPLVDGEIVDVETLAPDQSHRTAPLPTLYIGIGGVGIKFLKAIRSRVRDHDPQQALTLAWLALDTDREALRATCGEGDNDLSAEDRLHIPLRRPNQYRDDSQALLQWVSRRWLYNIPRSLQTRGFRPLGRIAAVDHAAALLTALQRRLNGLTTTCPTAAIPNAAARVVILAGMSGGTGGGTAIDIAQAVRALCREQGREVEVQAIFGCTFHHHSNDSLAAANMYSLLTELAHAQRAGNCGDSPPPGPAALYESPHRPFDRVYTVALSDRDGRPDGDLALQSVADYLLLNALGATEPVTSGILAPPAGGSNSNQLRTFGCVDLAKMRAQHAFHIQQGWLNAIVEHWLKQESSIDDPDARHFQELSSSRLAREVLNQFPPIATTAGSSLSESELNERRARRSAKVKYVAQGLVEFISVVQSQLPSDRVQADGPDATVVSKLIIEDACERLANGPFSDRDLTQEILEILQARLVRLTESATRMDVAELAEDALGCFGTGPLDCGYRRHTLLVDPQDRRDGALTTAMRERCPTLATFPARVSSSYLIREGSGVDPLHLGARLAESYPDIAEAAARLHSRDDIKWHDLRTCQG